MLPLIIGGAVAFLALKKPAKGAAANPAVPTSQPSNYQPAQPSLTYPYRPIVAPRVDNANQPWYNGAQKAVLGSNSPMGDVTGGIMAGSSVIHSMSDIWGNLSDMFGSNDSDSKANLTSTDSMPDDSYETGDPGTPDNSVVDNSNEEMGFEDMGWDW